MQRLSLSPWTRLVSLAVLLCALALAVAPMCLPQRCRPSRCACQKLCTLTD